MEVNASNFTIRTLQVGELEFPSGLLNFIICQIRLVLEKKPYIVQRNVDST
jgi:hypothetical protein